MVNGAKLEFHPNRQLRHVYKTIFFSHQGGSWHCLKYICSRVASVAQRFEQQRAKQQAQLGRTVVAPFFCNLNRRTGAIGKTRMVPKPSKCTTAWRLAWNFKRKPLAMKCQINNEKKQSFPNKTQNWIAFGSLVVTYNFAISLFCTAQSPFRTNLDLL